ncbi:divergent polysaccharide deacetylase family protein [Clostridium amazonitimonense]|uniref:divergent polysaccharide deacetylase family protein n=1 Tax=Clostridium amazonitimonense TaxID=1499689 RepID=UPI0006921347|nr:divergent polysaccharide deacetylase family protein [Clostridium amazonitimonense]
MEETFSIGSIEKQLDKAADLAIKEGSAIAIGHVGVEGGVVTANAIKNKVPELKKKGIEFVYLSQMP